VLAGASVGTAATSGFAARAHALAAERALDAATAASLQAALASVGTLLGGDHEPTRARVVAGLEGIAEGYERRGRGPTWLVRLVMALLRAIDVEGRGAVSPDDHALALRIAGRRPAPDAFAEVDADGDGFVRLDELEDALLRFLLVDDAADAGVRFFLGDGPR
jgi:hypothetical protein